MKKLLFAAYSLDVGGIEKALVTLLNELQKRGYEITLVLEKKEGIFLNEINSNIQIITYTPNNDKNILKRKFINFINQINFTLKYKNKFDFSASFATFSNAGAFVSRTASKNSHLWGHADYLTLFQNDVEETRKFFIEKKYNKFKKIVFVSKEGRDTFVSVFPEMKEKTIVCNNLIDNQKIEKLANEEIELKKEEITTFLNIGRHDEKQKKLSKIIEVAKKLKQENYRFKILFVGDGQDSDQYKEMVKQYQLEEQIIFLGRKQNPYPYFKISDCVVLTSDYEGYPVVFLESMILNKPLITTKVSDYEEVEGKYGFTTTKDIDDIYEKMKLFIENGFEIKEKFDAEKYNNQIIEKIENLIQ